MPLDKDQLQEIRRMLESRQDTLHEQSGAKRAKKTGAKKKSKSAKKTATKAKTRKKKLNPIESAIAHELDEVAGALERLDSQEHRFGYCERCFMEIPWGELVTNPARRFCSRCS